MRGLDETFPPRPSLRGRASDLATLRRTVEAGAKGDSRIALVGSGGSGKSVLAAALGHAVARRFGGRVHFVRIGGWDARTVLELLALRFSTPRASEHRVEGLRRFLLAEGPRLVVLDNHEDDRATAQVLDALKGTRTTFILTARRCLLSGVLVFPVTAPLVTAGRAAFPRVRALTRLLRWNPLALDLADALVASGKIEVSELARHLLAEGVDRVVPIEHEDDLHEVRILVEWALSRLSAASVRMLGVLAHVEGDHVDARSLAKLARTPRGADALRPLRALRLVQEPILGRFALHAVVRHAVRRRTEADPRRDFEHYVRLLERSPSRIVLEQTHVFAAMDHASRTGDLGRMLRVERLLSRLG